MDTWDFLTAHEHSLTDDDILALTDVEAEYQLEAAMARAASLVVSTKQKRG